MWHHPKELNKIEDFSKPIIYWTWNNKCGVFKDNIVFYGGLQENVGTLEQHINRWLNKCEKYAIKWWQFQDEIAPAGILSNGGSLSDWYGCEEEDITKEIWEAIGNKDIDKVKNLCNEIKK